MTNQKRSSVFGLGLVLALLSTNALAGTVYFGTLYPDGVRYAKALTKMECEPGNPEAPLLRWSETVNPSVATIAEQAGAQFEAEFTITIVEACDTGSATFAFSVEPDEMTGSSIDDFSAMGPAQISLPTDLGASQSTTVMVEIIDDDLAEGDERINLVRRDLSFQVGRFFGEVTNAPRILGGVTILAHSEVTVDPSLGPEISDPNARDAIPQVNAACDAATSEDVDLLAICSALQSASSTAVVEQILLAITPEEVTTQANASELVVRQQATNVSSRLSALRSSATLGAGYNSSVALVYNGQLIDMGMLASLFAAESEDPKRVGKPFDGRLGLFLNGQFDVGDRNKRGRQAGFEFDTWAITAGADYRITDKFFAGLAIGYGSYSSELDSDGGELDTDSLTFTAYSSYAASDNAYFDLAIGRTNGELEQARVVDLTPIGFSRRIARGDTDSDSTSISIGYNYAKYLDNGWTWTPHLYATYTDTTIDGFIENGADGVDLSFPEQNFESLVASAGMRVNKAISTSRGVWLPFLDITASSEIKDRGYQVSTLFVDTGTSGPSAFVSDSDSFYGRVDIGATFTFLEKGHSMFIRYSELLGYDETRQHTLTLGGRLEF